MNQDKIRPFHLAFPVNNINNAKKWYTEILGCTVGRESDNWIDFNLYGHQIVAHKSNNLNMHETNEVDGDNIPVRHFGVILKINDWKKLVEKLDKCNTDYIVKPHKRFSDKKGEQYTLFIKDPSGNALEFKAFRNDNMIFES